MAMQVKHFQGKTACLGKKPTALHITCLSRHCGTKRARISYSAKWWRFAHRWVLDFGGNFELIAWNGKESDFERAGKAGGSL